MMKFYLQRKDGTRRELTNEELSERLTFPQIAQALKAKREDPLEEVGYCTAGGVIVVDF